MSRVSPTLEGFRAAFHRPSLTIAEIACRWTAGAAACAVFFFWLIEYLNTLPVTKTDGVLLATRHPFLVGRALAHILRGSLNRAVLAALAASIALSLLWIIAASIGRVVTVRALLDYSRREVASEVSNETARKQPPLPALLRLNCLRAVLTLAAMLALVGAAILVGFVSSPAKPRPGLASVLFLPLAGLIGTVWPALNWLLSLAGVFAVRNGEDALAAVSAAVTFVRECTGPVFAVTTWAGLAHLTALSIAGTAVSLPLAFVHVAPSRLVIVVMLLVALAYFAVADWLYVARLAGYVCIAEMPEAAGESVPLPVPPPQTSIDRDEPILSDVPSVLLNLATET